MNHAPTQIAFPRRGEACIAHSSQTANDSRCVRIYFDNSGAIYDLLIEACNLLQEQPWLRLFIRGQGRSYRR